MTEQEKKYFEALVADRTENAKVLQKRSMRGVKDNAVNKYSDQAHFIYELLQNADDTAATAVRFELYPNKLVFAHNGTRQFSISNPATEDEDSDLGKLGDINSITSYYNSTKTEASIGKFGIGFKAVLQYTSKPEIYDDKFHFCIENQVVPHELASDYPGRQAGETLFVFPFVHAEKAYSDIANKLRSLSYPILFLSHLQTISFTIEDTRGLYAKETRTSKDFDQTTAENIHLVHNNGEALSEEDMWLFSRRDDAGRRYSVGFSLNENGALRPVQTDAYCFFKTKEHTGLNFFIHAPFLLNDSREHIVAGDAHNRNMVKLLAELAADSLVYLRNIGVEQGARLIDDSILDIVPTNEGDFHAINSTDNLSFFPFFTSIREEMSKEELLPTTDGYVSGKNAYWADTEEITQIISNEQLALLANNLDAHWVFVTRGRNQGRAKYTKYIDPIIGEKWCDENAIILGRKRYRYSNSPKDTILWGIDAHFVEQQSVEWLHSFYKWLSETDKRTKLIRTVPIFLNRNGHASAAFDKKDEPTLFLPSGRIEDVNTIAPELLNNPSTADFLIYKVGIKRASGRDYIYNVIRPKYENQGDADFNTDSDFCCFFDYYNECPKKERSEFIKLIRDWEFLIYYRDGKTYREKAGNLYFSSQELKDFFSAKPDAKFLDYDRYQNMVGIEQQEDLRDFLETLGVHTYVRIIMRTIQEENNSWETAPALGLPYRFTTRKNGEWTYPEIDGVSEAIHTIEETGDYNMSLLLWKVMVALIEAKCDPWSGVEDLLNGEYEYFYYRQNCERFLSPVGKMLRTRPWLMNRNSEFVCAEKLTIQELSENYDCSDDAAKELIRFLQIKDNEPAEDESNDNLTDEQREDIELGRLAREYNCTFDELRAILERERQKAATHPEHASRSDGSAAATPDAGTDADRAFRKSFDKQPPAKKAILRNIMRDRPENADVWEDEEETESDEYTPPAVDFKKRIQRAEEKSRTEIDKIAREQELSDLLTTAPRYTYAWFRALMELEALSRSENESGSREISISFGRVELEHGTERTLLLKQPSRYIPHWMEDLAADIPLTLYVKGREQRVMIEVASVKGYTLHTRLRNAEDLKGIDLCSASASISVQNPGFLLKSLQEGFDALNLSDDYDLKANLSENIKFVFGPPGTGKTTYLARKELIPMMRSAESEKVLVLAPTNKAADVLAVRIMELMGEDTSYKDWLIRFGTTYDEKIEQSEIYRDRSFYLPKLQRYVLVTTIARFPYDSIGGKRLCELDWDCIVIDEASMIPIANIIYPLYQSKPKQFIIAGDPLQIQPVAQVEPNENIYTMVGLKSFTNPHTEPYDYEVELLTTQYRSVPSVGEVFSQFAYGGVLEHARSEDSRRETNTDILDVAPLNIITFPVSKYEGIYRAKKLGGSTYQVYSALLAYEFAAFLARKIGAANPADAYSIGVISPYRAQADLIDRLLVRATLPSNVSVQAGTIHGFQGDECDTIIAVFNPPLSISDSRKMFLNKLNIINVSISRARDSLFVLMPDSETDHIERLKLVSKVERLIKNSEEYLEYTADEIEELIFGRTGYLEDNTFSTSHQNVNVYGLPEKRYEVRSEDAAIDVQIHEES